MVHKVKKYARRFGVLMVVLIFMVSSVVLPADASGYENGNFLQLLDYSTASDSGGNYINFVGSKTVFYDNPVNCDVSYVDMLVSFVGGVPLSVSAGRETKLDSLTIVNISENYYRVYGPITQMYIDKLYINFDNGTNTNRIYCTIYSLNISTFNVSSVPSIGSLSVYDPLSGYRSVTMSSPSDEPEIFLTQDEGSTLSWADFICTVYLKEFQKFDYMDVLLYLDVEHINSILVKHGDLALDFDVSYLSPADQVSTYYWVMIHVDLSSVDRTSTIIPAVQVTGTYYNQVNYNKISLKSITGFVAIPEVSEVLSFWYKLKTLLSSNFNTLFAKLDEAFGLNDDSASSAQQTQEEINVSVNNQLVGAVEDWNTHIEVVETGYDMAFTQTTPTLNWIASLANGIYSGLGWFGKLYLLIGLISVFMLVLSKSGLSRKIGSSIRRSG